MALKPRSVSFNGTYFPSIPVNFSATNIGWDKTPELAANIESNASYLGNMIPPSGNIVAALGALAGVIGVVGLDREITQGEIFDLPH